jgi:hypothetical protein
MNFVLCCNSACLVKAKRRRELVEESLIEIPRQARDDKVKERDDISRIEPPPPFHFGESPQFGSRTRWQASVVRQRHGKRDDKKKLDSETLPRGKMDFYFLTNKAESSSLEIILKANRETP